MADVSATVIAPLLESIAKAPEQDWAEMAYETVLVEPSASDDDAVISADAPFETSSASVLLSESVSVWALSRRIRLHQRLSRIPLEWRHSRRSQSR